MNKKGKGGKNRRRGKNANDDASKNLVKKDEEGQEYATVVRMLGNGRFEGLCMDGKTRLCHIRGKMRKKQWVNTGDVVLLGLREYEDGKADCIMKYTAEEARKLKAEGELPDKINLASAESAKQEDDDDDCAFDFEDL